MELEFITAGQVVNTHGIRGDVKILPQGVDPYLLTECSCLYIGDKAYEVQSGRVHKGCVLARLAGVADMDAALALKGRTVTFRRGEVKLPEGSYFDEELTGLTARDADTGEEIGRVEEVLHYPAHDIYAVRGGKDEYLVPAVEQFIAAVDVRGGTIDIRMMEGLGAHEN